MQDTKDATKKDGASTESAVKTTTLDTFGNQFPVGNDGEPRAFSFKAWTMKEEREIGALRDQNRNATMPEYVAMILGTMATKWGKHDFGNMKLEERRVILSQAWTADIFHAYARLRFESLGPDLRMKITCALCGHEFDFTGDLSTLEIRTVGKLADALWSYDLKTPIEVRGKKVERLKLGPQRWNVVETMQVSGQYDISGFKIGVILGSIHEIEGVGSIPLGGNELDEMTKRDIEGLSTLIDDHRVGPDMSIKGKCPKCKREFLRSLDWGYDDFFASSSR